LLNTAHPSGAAKAKFFMSFGFSPGDWIELKGALLNHPHKNPVTTQVRSPFGQKFEVSSFKKGRRGLMGTEAEHIYRASVPAAAALVNANKSLPST
jgi:hypothetical protein